VKYRFEEGRVVREDAVYVVEADSLQEACRKYVARRMADEPPDDGESEVIDSEVVSVTDEYGDSHLDQALDYIDAAEDHCARCGEPINRSPGGTSGRGAPVFNSTRPVLGGLS
jgi:hypothetical protein